MLMLVHRQAFSVVRNSLAAMKMSSKKLQIIIAYSLGLIISVFQFLTQRQHHLKLQNEGIIAKAASSYSEAWGSSYVDFSFKTSSGETIFKSEKCGDKQTFDKLYSTMLVIYNPKNPK